MITYSATLDVPEATATLLTDLLIAERRRRRRGTGIGARAASARIQAVLVRKPHCVRAARGRRQGGPAQACHTKAEIPVRARPTISELISRVPSKL